MTDKCWEGLEIRWSLWPHVMLWPHIMLCNNAKIDGSVQGLRFHSTQFDLI